MNDILKVLFLTGAGISANAGIATYRDTGSSWTDSDLEAKSHANSYGNHLDELWDRHWGPLGETMKRAEPTYAHKAIAKFQNDHEVIIATQNIDDLHERAGSDNVAHLHGAMNIYCMRCRQRADSSGWANQGAPACARCGKRRTRPAVVLFGEMLNAKMMKGLERFARSADFVIAVGTSLNVFPAAGLVMDNANRSIIINKQKTSFDKWATAVYNDDADKVIDEVLEGLT